MTLTSGGYRGCLARQLVGGAGFVVLALALGGCYAYPWRPAGAPLASVAAAGAPLRVTTRPLANEETHRYVLSWARVAGDSLVGVVRAEYRRTGAGRWSFVPQTERARRVAVDTADIAEVSRQEREPSGPRTIAILLALTALAYAVHWAALHPKEDT
jgi:hypothetical protein